MDPSISDSLENVIQQYGQIESWSDLPENFGAETAEILTDVIDWSQPSEQMRSDLERVIAMCTYAEMALDAELITA